MTRLKISVDGNLIKEEIVTPFFNLGQKSLDRFAAAYAKENGISPTGVRVYPVADKNTPNPYANNGYRKEKQ